MEINWYYIIALLVIIFLVFLVFVTNDETNLDSGVYSKPGICPYCNTKLAKTVSSSAYHDNICWYCPNEDCPH